MQTQIVLLSGKQGAGKTTTAKQLEQLLYRHGTVGVAQVTFAGPLYHIHNYCRDYLKSLGIQFRHEVAIKDGPLLQYLGTEWGRKTIGESVWVDAAKGLILNSTADFARRGYKRVVTVISDCRFENELYSFPDALRVRLECTRDVRKVRAEMWRENEMHPSEISLDDHVFAGKFDFVFDTANASPMHCATLICAQLDKNNWVEKRK